VTPIVGAVSTAACVDTHGARVADPLERAIAGGRGCHIRSGCPVFRLQTITQPSLDEEGHQDASPDGAIQEPLRGRPGMTGREQLLDELRPVSFAIAYRMLGSVAEAEDVVQEALLRVHQAIEDGERIRSPRAFVATITTRLAINALRSARARREQYVGEWLPEPIITDGRDDPAQHAEMADSLSLATLVLLESLSPEQRAVLLLHDVFDYDHAQIAEIIGKSEANTRQIATRARRHVEQRRPRFQTTREQQEELAARFFAAAERGDLAGLEELLASDVTLTGDGGGKAPALARTLRGRSRVAQMLVEFARTRARVGELSLRRVEINGGPGALNLDGQGRLISVWALDIAGGQIRAVSSIVNPVKLAHLGPVGDFGSLLRGSES
jgi:RNA polymerase sigma-70 factor (TIGR02957 family)